MKKLILILAFTILGSCQYAYAQTTPSTDDQLKECSAMLDQSIEEARSCKSLAETRLNEVNSLKGTIAADAKLITIYEDMVKRYDARIKYLESKICNEFSLIKIGFIKILSFKKCL